MPGHRHLSSTHAAGNKPAPWPFSSLLPKVDGLFEEIWWPTRNASDRQLVYVGFPFIRKGEVVLVERINGVLKSRYLGQAPPNSPNCTIPFD